MRFVYRVEVEVERITGKFVSREEISAEFLDGIEGADPGSVYVEDSEYEVTVFDVTEEEEKKR